jgi:elongation factor 3
MPASVKEQQAQAQVPSKASPATGAATEVSLAGSSKTAAAPAATPLTITVVEAQRAVEELIAASQDKKDAVKRQKAFTDMAAMCSNVNFCAYEPFLLTSAVEVMLAQARDKQVLVREAAVAALHALVKTMCPYSTSEVLDMLIPHLGEESHWQVKLAAINAMTVLAKSNPRQFATTLGKVIAATKETIFDLKKEVSSAASECIETAYRVCENRDLEPFIPSLVKAMSDPTEVPECIQGLASTTFVQTVDSAALSIIVPLLVRGFREPVTSIKRQCSVIVANMSKLVEDPAEASPLLPELLPALQRASEEISDPEARAVATRALDQINKIRDAANHAMERKAGEQAVVDGLLANLLKGTAAEKAPTALAILGRIATMMIDCKHLEMPYWTKHMLPMVGVYERNAAKALKVTEAMREKCAAYAAEADAGDEEDETGEELCNCKFTLAYGTKILLHNTAMKLIRGCRYGLLGGNDSGKSTLLRAIANGSVEGFPPATELRTVFVEADIQGEMSHLPCIEYILVDPKIKACNVDCEEISKVMSSVGFTEKMQNDMVTTLSGGWRMKLALARAMLQKADILLLDEPTNHLDVINVKWVQTYLNSLTNVTSIIVSHDSGLLDNCCTHILQIDRLKLNCYKGNLSDFVQKFPEAKAYFQLKSDKLKFSFPQPGFLDGVKSKGKALMKMDKVFFTYPGNTKPTVNNITIQVSLGSRVACVGVNGAGKSTIIKLLTGELEPSTGTVWKFPGTRVAYVAQHAFHHIEKHLTKTPTQYLQWRYENGEDKEGLDKVTLKITDEEAAKLKTPVVIEVVDASGNVAKIKRVIARLTGGRRTGKKGFEYEVMFEGCNMDSNTYLSDVKLDELGYTKHMKQVDAKVEAREGMYARPLTQDNIETHIENVGLSREFASHYRMSALSGGQKVKVVLAAAMWNQPHIVILDEPTNYLDRESLGALAGAIEVYEGGVVMITHNNEFCSQLCPETWVMENGLLDCRGDPEWMKNASNFKVEFKQIEEMVDAAGNTTKVKAPKKKLTRKEKLAREKHRKMMRELGEPVSDSDSE